MSIAEETELIGKEYIFETKLGDIESNEIEFGDYAGRPKWEKLTDVPDQRIRDALAHLIEFQGDTEFASVEQQRFLFELAPSDWDRNALVRVMVEEMRHGWQMCALLLEYFGHSGKVEAQKLLERRAEFEHIVDAIRGVARGEQGWVSQQVSARLSAWMQEQASEKTRPLTPREIEVLRHVVDGKTNQEIAFALGISEKTVEKHLEGVFSKLGVTSRVEAAVYAVRVRRR